MPASSCRASPFFWKRIVCPDGTGARKSDLPVAASAPANACGLDTQRFARPIIGADLTFRSLDFLPDLLLRAGASAEQPGEDLPDLPGLATLSAHLVSSHLGGEQRLPVSGTPHLGRQASQPDAGRPVVSPKKSVDSGSGIKRLQSVTYVLVVVTGQESVCTILPEN